MSQSDRFQKMNPKEFMEALRQEVKAAIYRFGRYSTQERTASSKVWGASQMQRRCNKEIKKRDMQIALFMDRISAYLHRQADDEVLEHLLAQAIDDYPAAEVIMNWRDELKFAENKIKELESELEIRLRRIKDLEHATNK